MAGKKGSGGPIPENIRIYAQTHVLEDALPKIAAYLRSKPIGSKHWTWCHEELKRLGHLNDVSVLEGGGSHESNLALLA